MHDAVPYHTRPRASLPIGGPGRRQRCWRREGFQKDTAVRAIPKGDGWTSSVTDELVQKPASTPERMTFARSDVQNVELHAPTRQNPLALKSSCQCSCRDERHSRSRVASGVEMLRVQWGNRHEVCQDWRWGRCVDAGNKSRTHLC